MIPCNSIFDDFYDNVLTLYVNSLSDEDRKKILLLPAYFYGSSPETWKQGDWAMGIPITWTWEQKINTVTSMLNTMEKTYALK